MSLKQNRIISSTHAHQSAERFSTRQPLSPLIAGKNYIMYSGELLAFQATKRQVDRCAQRFDDTSATDSNRFKAGQAQGI